MSSSTEGEWVEIVPPSAFAVAKQAFEEWKTARGLGGSDVSDDEIRIDVIRVRDGSQMRYLVKRDALRRLGLVTTEDS